MTNKEMRARLRDLDQVRKDDYAKPKASKMNWGEGLSWLHS